MRRTTNSTVVLLGVLAVLVGTFEPAAAERRGVGAAARRAVIIAAGDISPEGGGFDDDTAAIIEDIGPDAVLTLGDNQYPNGELADFNRYYDETWGQFRDITYPSPGNHDCHVRGCAGYFDYFGRRAHDGSYAFRIGGWLMISLNSESDLKAQNEFLDRTLSAGDARCQLVYWHEPRWSSGFHGNHDAVAPWWATAYAAGVDVILAGHDHDYERFTRLDAAGDHARDGIRSFVVGTGGAELYHFESPVQGSMERIREFGVLRLRVDPKGYTWAFRDIQGDNVDSGHSGCTD